MPVRLKLERDVRDPCVKWAKDHGWLHIRLHFGRGAARGWPDDVFIKKGRVSFVEFKRPSGCPTALQQMRIKALCDERVQAFWTDSVNHFKAVLLRP